MILYDNVIIWYDIKWKWDNMIWYDNMTIRGQIWYPSTSASANISKHGK